MTPDNSYLLEARGIVKQFPGVRALGGVDFLLRKGEVHALMGENGAGKSTLIKVLTGVYPSDGGSVLLEGRPVAVRSPREAQEAGISTVYQEVNLIPHLSVAENLFLGREPRRMGLIRWGEVRRMARETVRRLNIDADVDAPLSSCSVAIQQMVAIARAVGVSARVLILDEPTSSLDTAEVQQLFGFIRKLKEEGLGIVFVTHFLDQVYQVSDRITVLRNGELVGEYEAAGLARVELVARMLGKSVEEVAALESRQRRETPGDTGSVVVEADGLSRRGAVEQVAFSVKRGEVLGLAGLLGSGRTETARLLFGIDKPEGGEIRVRGAARRKHTPCAAVADRFGYCPEDRKTQSIIPDLSVRENMLLALQGHRGVLRRLSRKAQNEIVDRYIGALSIKTPGPEQKIRNLSGGNQQKVILARWLAMNPELLILDEPTRGIDVGTRAEIEKLIVSLAGEGMAVVFISSELEEIVRCADRVVVLRDRKKVGELTGGQISEHGIMHAIAETEEARGDQSEGDARD